MTLHRLNHALAFIFGGYQDYEKFYTPSILHEDGGLFVAILERLSERSSNEEEQSLSKVPTDETFESDVEYPNTSCSCQKLNESNDTSKKSSKNCAKMVGQVDVNPVRLAAAHIQLRHLKGHEYNIFEASFFYDPDGDRGEYILNVMQVVVAYLGIFYLFYFLGNVIRKTYETREVLLKDENGEDKEWVGILAINMIGLGYFFFLLGRDVERVMTFSRALRKLCPYDQYTSHGVKMHRWWSLVNNFFVNIWMGYALFVLNFFFVQSVNDMVDAILNAIAVIFIIQLDDVIPPYRKIDRTVFFLNLECCPVRPRYWLDWENSAIHGKLMEIVENYLSRPDASMEAVTVTKVTGHSIVFRETDVCYFFVNKSDSLIRVFHGRMHKHSPKYTHVFDEVTYQIRGGGAAAFLDNMAQFECVQEEEGPKKLELLDGRKVRKAV